jgi:hypothetical protein
MPLLGGYLGLSPKAAVVDGRQIILLGWTGPG